MPMIPADHKKWARLIFDPWIDRQMRKHFTACFAVNDPPEIPAGHSLVCTPNHISWWDGFFIYYIYRKYFPERAFYILMLEQQLKRFWFFRKLGAHSINLENPRSLIDTVEYVRNILCTPETLSTIYPQGEIEPFDKRPLTLKPGLKKMTEGVTTPVSVIPMAFKIQYYNEKQPDLYVSFSERLVCDVKGIEWTEFTRRFQENIDFLQKNAINRRYQRRLW